MTNEQYHTMISPYQDAINLILNRLEILDHKAGDQNEPPLIHSTTSRIKEKNSIEKKLGQKDLEPSVSNARNLLQDIAGVRVICFFEQDIRQLTECLKKQSDLIVIREKDYIKTPKINGYRSYHLIMGVPIYYMEGMEYYPVEIQFRTISMDFWAAMEHRICYKNQQFDQIAMRKAFLQYSEILEKMEKSFEAYNDNCSPV